MSDKPNVVMFVSLMLTGKARVTLVQGNQYEIELIGDPTIDPRGSCATTEAGRVIVDDPDKMHLAGVLASRAVLHRIHLDTEQNVNNLGDILDVSSSSPKGHVQ